MIHAQLIEDQASVFFLLGQQIFQLLLPRRLLLLKCLGDIPAERGLVDQQLLVLLDLLAEEALLEVAAHADPLEARLRDDDRVPVAGGDLRRQNLATLLGEVFLASHQELRIGVKLHELAAELFQHVVRYATVLSARMLYVMRPG